MFGSINNCHNVKDFRNLAKKRLPSPIFHYIDGAADDEITYKRNTDAYEQCDLIPNVLSGVDKVDMSTTVMGQKLDMPLYCAPTALQRLFHHEGEIGVAKAALCRPPALLSHTKADPGTVTICDAEFW